MKAMLVALAVHGAISVGDCSSLKDMNQVLNKVYEEHLYLQMIREDNISIRIYINRKTPSWSRVVFNPDWPPDREACLQEIGTDAIFNIKRLLDVIGKPL